MKVVMIIPSLGAGGAERVISSLANEWVNYNKCTLEIILLTNSLDFYEIDSRIKIHRLSYEGGSKYKKIGLMKNLFELKSLINFISPDTILSFTRESNIITLLATIGSKNKVFISERDSPLAEVSRFYGFLRKITYPYANGLIVQTHDYKDFALDALGVKNIQVIPNPVRKINCSNKRKEKIIINVGRLIPEKGQLYLLESFALCKNKKDWKLVIVGDGALKVALENKSKELGIEEYVNFAGKTTEVDEWLCRSSIFAFTSISEGFPNALAEAMSASLPCISFDCITGPKELIEDKVNGYLVDVGDISTFSKQLDVLIDSEDIRKKIGLAAKNSVEKLDLEFISKQYFSFISS